MFKCNTWGMYYNSSLYGPIWGWLIFQILYQLVYLHINLRERKKEEGEDIFKLIVENEHPF